MIDVVKGGQPHPEEDIEMNEKDLGAMVIPTKHTYQVEMKVEGSDDYESSFEWFWTKEEAMKFIEQEFKDNLVTSFNADGVENNDGFYTHAELYTNLSFAEGDFDHPVDSIIDQKKTVDTEVIRRS